jgi:hypothetical protein
MAPGREIRIQQGKEKVKKEPLRGISQNRR